MAPREKIEASESQIQIGLVMDRLAHETAQNVAALVEDTIRDLINHKQEWEGGKFQVMHKLTRGMSEAQLNALPDPKADTGNNPAWYFFSFMRDGKEHTEKRYYYEQMALAFPANVAKMKRISQLERSSGDENVNKSDIPADIMDMDPTNRVAELSRLNDEINESVKSVTGAFELRAQLLRFADLRHVEAFPIFRTGPDGLPMNGEDGRPFDIERTKRPICVRSTIKGRELKDCVYMGIQKFVSLNVGKISDAGGTFKAMEDSIPKKAKKGDQAGGINPAANAQDQSKPQQVGVPDTFIARAVDMYSFADKAWEEKNGAAMGKLRQMTHGDGTDEYFTALHGLMRFLRDIVGSPKDEERYQRLIASDDGNPQGKAA